MKEEKKIEVKMEMRDMKVMERMKVIGELMKGKREKREEIKKKVREKEERIKIEKMIERKKGKM